MNKTKINKYFDSAKTACGWLLGVQAYAVVYYVVVGLMNYNEGDVVLGIWLGFIGIIFFWLVRRLYKEFSFKNAAAIFLTYFGFIAFDIGYYVADLEWISLGLKMIICLPILFFLGRATRATVHMLAVKEGR